MDTVHTPHERSLNPDDSRRFTGLCHDALAVAYGTDYYADELSEISAELCAEFTNPIIVKCNEYSVSLVTDDTIDIHSNMVKAEGIANYTSQPYPEGVISGIITPELIAMTESDKSDHVARTPYVVVANPGAGRVFFVKVQDVQELLCSTSTKLD